MTMTDAAAKLAPLFLQRGYAFFYPCRRGQGLSADQAPFMQDLLKREAAAKGKDARSRLQFVLMTTDHLEDVMAALSVLKNIPGIDAKRIALAGHSFGGKLTLLAAERDPSLRAAVTFADAAESWDQSPELRERLLAAVRKTNASIMLIHASNDYGTSAGVALAAELKRLHKPHILKIYPPVGRTPDDGHNELYEATSQWEKDVLQFLSDNLRH
jgi:dipeptidyl aminopeptidase/acylaminoacyl peptidase